MAITAVIFDYGQTLITFTYPRVALLEAMEEARPLIAAAVGEAPAAEALVAEVLEPLELDLEAIAGEVEIDFMALYAAAWRRAGLDLPDDLLARILDLEQRRWDEAVELAPGALDALDRLRSRGLKTAVASNAPFPPEQMHRQLARNGLAERLDAAVFSSEVGWRKPAHQLYQAALDRLGCPAEAALYVGDKVVEDYQGPRRLGLRAVICTTFARPPGDGVPTVAGLDQIENIL